MLEEVGKKPDSESLLLLADIQLSASSQKTAERGESDFPGPPSTAYDFIRDIAVVKSAPDTLAAYFLVGLRPRSSLAWMQCWVGYGDPGHLTRVLWSRHRE